jgi:hypothetical protein
VNQDPPRVKERALEQIAHLNGLLTELLEQSGSENQTDLWSQIMTAIAPPRASER